MRARDVAGDGEAEAGSKAFLQRARFVALVERTEHIFALIRRNARPVVIDMHDQEALVAGRADLDVLAIPQGV